MEGKRKYKLKIVYNILAVLIYKALTSFSYCGIEEITDPLKNKILSNFKILILTIILTAIVLFLLSFIIKKITGTKIITGSFLNNKFVRFIEVFLFISIIAFLISEYTLTWKKHYSVGGIIIAIFAFYQRVSNKNRKYAYISLIVSIILYIVFRVLN